MATYTGTACASGVMPRRIHAGVNSVTAQHVVSGSLSAGDVVQLVKIPGGATVLQTILTSTITPAQVVLSLGDGGNTGRFMVSQTYTSSVYLSNAGVPYKYSFSDDAAVQWDTIDVRVQTASGSGNTTFALTVLFTMDP